jgi:hypothetical protein
MGYADPEVVIALPEVEKNSQLRSFGKSRPSPLPRLGLASVMGICDVSVMPKDDKAVHRPRRSASADAALRAEIERVSRMTVEERITASLTMPERFAWIQPEKKSRPSGEK